MIKPLNKDNSPLNAPSLPFIITKIFQWSSHTLSDASAWTQVPTHSHVFKYALLGTHHTRDATFFKQLICKLSRITEISSELLKSAHPHQGNAAKQKHAAVLLCCLSKPGLLPCRVQQHLRNISVFLLLIPGIFKAPLKSLTKGPELFSDTKQIVQMKSSTWKPEWTQFSANTLLLMEGLGWHQGGTWSKSLHIGFTGRFWGLDLGGGT